MSHSNIGEIEMLQTLARRSSAEIEAGHSLQPFPPMARCPPRVPLPNRVWKSPAPKDGPAGGSRTSQPARSQGRFNGPPGAWNGIKAGIAHVCQCPDRSVAPAEVASEGIVMGGMGTVAPPGQRPGHSTITKKKRGRGETKSRFRSAGTSGDVTGRGRALHDH